MFDDEMEHHHAKSRVHGWKRKFNSDDEAIEESPFQNGLVTDNAPMTKPPRSNHPKCAITECGNPKIRDLYMSDRTKREVFIDWLYVKSDDHWRNAEHTAKAMTHFLNKVYAHTGFRFSSRVHFFDLTQSLANKLGVDDVSELENMRVHKYDCADREDKHDTKGTICVEAHKLMVALRGSKWQELGAFQLIPVTFTREVLNGFGKFPWSSDHGMLIIAHQALQKGATTLPHEMGHCLGLLHTFSGWSADRCHACSETNPDGDDLTGDLISDTPPMPQWQPMRSMNTCNSNPDASQYPPTCVGSWNKTPNSNIMSYGTCRHQVTPQQMSRMKCFADRIIQRKFWKEE